MYCNGGIDSHPKNSSKASPLLGISDLFIELKISNDVIPKIKKIINTKKLIKINLSLF